VSDPKKGFVYSGSHNYVTMIDRKRF